MTRRGVTLVELLVVVVLLGGVVATGLTVLGGVSVAGRRGAERIAAAKVTGVVGTLLRLELAGAPPGDVTVGSGAMRYARPVGHAPVCASGAAGVTYARAAWEGYRMPEADRDGVLLLDATGHWVGGAILSVGPGHCPGGGAGVLLVPAQPAAGAYLQVLEPVRLTIYRSGAHDWFGLGPSDGSVPVQPFAGPIAAGSGRLALDGARLTVAARPPTGPGTAMVIPLREDP